MDNQTMTNMKFCKFCGEKIDADAVVCIKCGKQVEELKKADGGTPNIVINNANNNTNTNMNMGGPMYYATARNKWVAFFLCLFLGYLGAHKFYEGKTGMGILYVFTMGLFGIGWFFDCITILFKPNPYYVR